MTERYFDDDDLEAMLDGGIDGARDLRHLIADHRAALGEVEALRAERDALAERVDGYRGLLDGAWLRGYHDALSACPSCTPPDPESETP